MTELELYKYIEDNNIEWHYGLDEEDVEDVVILPLLFQIESFSKMLSSCHFDDDGLEMKLKDGYVAIWMKDICEYYGLSIYNVFDKKKYLEENA